MTTRPKQRSHAALKFAAGVMRLAAVLIGGLTLLATLSIVSATGTATRGVADLAGGGLASSLGQAGGLAALVVAAIGLTYAVFLWAIADVFVLLADGDDIQRRLEFHLASLMTRADRSETLTPVSAIPEGGSPAPTRFVVVGPTALRVFGAPDRTARTIGRAEPGTQFELVGERGEFVEVRTPEGIAGFLPRVAVRMGN